MYYHMNCLKCGNNIKLRVVIDGKLRTLYKRKFCLECSPFGKHNTRNVIHPSLSKSTRICPDCKKPYVHKGTRCNACRVVLWRRKIKQRLVVYKGGKCEMCGYNRCLSCLTFHHIDPSKKDFQISGMTGAYDKILKEVDKCKLLCHNCHGELHSTLLGCITTGRETAC